VNTVILVVAIVLLAGVLLARVNKQFGFPVLIGFVAIGAVFATVDPSVLESVTPTVAKNLSYLALAFILFEGGLHTSLKRIRRAWAPSLSLATVGVLVSAAIMTLLAQALLGLPLISAALLGVAASSTDAASVFSVLGGTALRRRLVDVLEVESGTNDPMAFFLTTILIEWSQHDLGPIRQATWHVLGLFVLEMGLGLIIGVLIGLFGAYINRRIRLDTGGLYPALSLGFALLSFALAQSLEGSGFLSVFVTAVVLSHGHMEHRYSIIRFHEGLAWTMHILMFVVLGFFLVPRDFAYIVAPGIVLALGTLFVARPIAVWLSTLGAGLTNKERAFISWAGLRGAAPIVLILSAVEAQVTGHIEMIEVVFFIVIASTLVQGLTVNWFAERLNLVDPTPTEDILELISIARESAVILPVEISLTSRLVEKRMVDIKFPENTLCYGIVRGDHVVVPRGATKLRSGDHLLILSDARHIQQLRRLFAQEQVGQPTMLP
jgi:cell volume regulation protein A